MRKCKYCDFISFENRYDTQMQYADALTRELCQYDLSEYDIKTIFFGGGTPSSVSATVLEKVLDAVKLKCSISDSAEITVECNPCSLDECKLKKYRELGVNRISIGVQSFDDAVLNTIGRLHDAAVAENAVQLAKKCGFSNVSIDLMFSIPGQSEESVIDSVKKGTLLGVEHISMYSLIVEDGTPLSKLINDGKLTPVDEESDRHMYNAAKKLLCENGYSQYEVSNFAKKGFESRHNIVYWERGEYIGIGCAAHSFFNGVRYCNTSDLDAYLSEVNVADIMSGGEAVNDASKAEETVMLGLRMNKGISVSRFEYENGFDITKRCEKSLSRLATLGLIAISDGRLYATDKGRDVLNYVIVEIISDF